MIQFIKEDEDNSTEEKALEDDNKDLKKKFKSVYEQMKEAKEKEEEEIKDIHNSRTRSLKYAYITFRDMEAVK